MSRRHVIMFKPQFSPLVKSGAKLQTIRPRRVRTVIFGDVVDAREWIGKPYRSKQRKLRECVALSTESIKIHRNGVEISPGTLRVFFMGAGTRRQALLDSFARADGFADWAAMKDWFTETHGLPFEGVLIKWKL